MSTEIQRKLTTILAADAAGFSRHMEADEVGTLADLRAGRDVFARFIERHHGRVANTAGDGLIAEFPSVVEAVQCAIEVQSEIAATPNQSTPLRFRIGIHLGDVIVDGEDLLGEGVNLAARLQGMAEPRGVLISQQVFDQVRNKLTVGFDYLGEKRPRNYSEDVPVYRVSSGSEKTGFRFARKKEPPGPRTTTPPRAKAQDPWDVQNAVIRNALICGVLLAALLVIDLVTGGAFWTHWPAVVLFGAIGLQAAPLVFRSRTSLLFARIAVLAACLVLINLFTWTGYFWALWPVGVAIVIALIWKVAGPRSAA
ncbi:MAG: adenylate/guanylate cyclase domain-containing protein [Pseudomonadota bacterium]